MSSLGTECVLDCRVVHWAREQKNHVTMATQAIRREERMVKGILKDAKGKLQYTQELAHNALYLSLSLLTFLLFLRSHISDGTISIIFQTYYVSNKL